MEAGYEGGHWLSMLIEGVAGCWGMADVLLSNGIGIECRYFNNSNNCV